MYIGRFVVVGPGIATYRVSSRSFPDRKLIDRDGTLTVTPDGQDTAQNPYVSYNCLRQPAGDPAVVVGNGSHVDPITEHVSRGYPWRDALVLSLLALDFEKDDYDTPRLAGIVGQTEAAVGIVRRDGLIVRRVAEPTLVATYEKASPEPFAIEAATAQAAAEEVYRLEFDHAVCAAGAVVTAEGATVALHNGS